MSKYGDTFLTKQRWFTDDDEKVETSLIMWSESDGPHRWSTSILGVINGILYTLGDWRRLIATVEEDGTISKWEFRKWHAS